MKNSITIILLLLLARTKAQTITPEVLNSAGTYYTNSVNGVFLTDNVGETFVSAYGIGTNIILSEGFLQPFVISPRFDGSAIKNDVSCIGKKDGMITVSVTTNINNAQFKYCWKPVSVCPDSSCSSIDSLQPGSYSVKVIASYTLGAVVKTDTSISKVMMIDDQKNPCKIKLFSGVSPNNDGVNDIWVIDNIEEFPKNKVQIYNRWGQKVFEADKYDNKEVYWPNKIDNELVSSTYFYIIDLGDGSPLFKGWVELIRN